jgi:hypothetical protein
MEKLVYRAPVPVLDAEAMDAIARDDVERLKTLPIDVAFHHENWRFIQDLCVRLSDHKDPIVRGNALEGFELVAQFHRRLEKNVVKPVLLRGQKDEDAFVAAKARDAIASINHRMKWRIGGAKRQKEIEAKFDRNRR